MKRTLGFLFAAAAAAVVPVATAGALTNSPDLAEYRPECENFYNQGKQVFDPLIASPAKAVLGPLEAGVCGENQHVK